MPFSIKKIKSYCGTKHLTKDQVKKIQKKKKKKKKKMGQWIDDIKVCIFVRILAVI